MVGSLKKAKKCRKSILHAKILVLIKIHYPSNIFNKKHLPRIIISFQCFLCTLLCLFYAFIPYCLIWVTDFIKYSGRVTILCVTSQDSQARGSQEVLSNLSILWFGYLFWGGSLSLFWQFPPLFHVNGFARAGWQRSSAWQGEQCLI